MEPQFQPFPKIPRLNREMTVTEKIDGTNACILITECGAFFTGSRSRWITPKDDNFGFSSWAHAHKEELLKLGPGTHFGEWWGSGIQRGYGLKEKRFSLFNVDRWCLYGKTPAVRKQIDPTQPPVLQEVLPECVGLVPLLYTGKFDTKVIGDIVHNLALAGSQASPGFLAPEGVMVYHKAANQYFKVTVLKDEEPKGKGNR